VEALDPSRHGRELPRGTVTFLFSDIEGSTRLLQSLGPRYADLLADHHRLIRSAFGHHGGVEVDTQGDAFFVAFAKPSDAIAAAVGSQRALLTHPWPHGDPVSVRMGIHTGEPVVVDEGYVGIDVHRAARICGAAHGGQVVVSEVTRHLIEPGSSDGITFMDLGRHRLKDLDQAERLFQVVAEDLPETFPPLRSLRPPTNIPSYATDLIGRDVERQTILRLLQEEGVRLVTITGPGGSGKTRLALSVTHDLVESFDDGAYFVDLTPARSAHEMFAAIIETLRMRSDDDVDPLEVVTEHLRDRNMLLLLDNFEQAIEAAPALSTLLQACRGIVVLTTSRVVLSVRGEHELPIGPLGLPRGSHLSDVASAEAVRLFAARAAAVRPGFKIDEGNAAPVAELCRMLDGLPLAIELAAARIKIFSPDALVTRLDDRLKLLSGGGSDSPLRHRAMRATIDWSYDLLGPDERIFFRDFGVFSGGASLDAIEEVLQGDAFELLSALVNHSLVQQREDAAGEPRFRMLQLIREYALELLEASPDARSVRDRHADHYASVAATLDPLAIGVEYGNLMSALAWLVDQAEAGAEEAGVKALSTAGALGEYWYTHGQIREGTRWLERALRAAPGAPDEVRAVASRRLGILCEQQGDLDRARELLEDALAHARAASDRALEGACLNSLAIVARSEGDLENAQLLLEQAVAIRRRIHDEAGVSSSLNNLAIVAIDRGDPVRGIELLEQSLAIDKKLGNDWGVAAAAASLAVAHLESGSAEVGRPYGIEAVTLFAAEGDLDGAADALEGLAGVFIVQGDLVKGTRLAGAAHTLRRTIGSSLAMSDEARMKAWLEQARAGLGEQGYDSAFQEGAAMTIDQAASFASS
jgi:predicted ATPase/class 3 adenylate cyclase